MYALSELLLLLAVALPPVEEPAQDPPPAPVARDSDARPGDIASRPEVLTLTTRWSKRLRRSRGTLEAEHFDELEGLVAELRLLWAQDEVWRDAILLELLDLLGVALYLEDEHPQRGDGYNDPIAMRTRQLTTRVLRPRLDREVLRWLVREVLVMDRLHGDERRAAALHLIGPRREPESLLPLMMCTRSPSPLVRMSAVQALCGWPDEAVFQFFIDELIKSQTGDSQLEAWALEKHFKEAGLCPAGRTSTRILRYVRRSIGSGKWREASRSIAVIPAISDNLAIPLLIESMELWVERAKSGHRSVRIQYEIARELERRSGRTIGMHPERWKRWWNAVEAGQIPPPDAESGEKFSKASFFGIRPSSDRVTFVIDRSASMQTLFGPATTTGAETGVQRSRYLEAIEQMMRFLQAAGEKARFNVILFHSGSNVWRSRLATASPENLKAARSWLLARRPNGNTLLRNGIERAMMLKASGKVDLNRLEADTIIVLCDGATFEGPDWVLPVLRRANHEARLMIHGVQIGRGGDGTLELLSSETGGEFVGIDG